MNWIGPKAAIQVIREAQLNKGAEVSVTFCEWPGRRYLLYIDDSRTPIHLDPWLKES